MVAAQDVAYSLIVVGTVLGFFIGYTKGYSDATRRCIEKVDRLIGSLTRVRDYYAKYGNKDAT